MPNVSWGTSLGVSKILSLHDYNATRKARDDHNMMIIISTDSAWPLIVCCFSVSSWLRSFPTDKFFLLWRSRLGSLLASSQDRDLSHSSSFCSWSSLRSILFRVWKPKSKKDICWSIKGCKFDSPFWETSFRSLKILNLSVYDPKERRVSLNQWLDKIFNFIFVEQSSWFCSIE
jgi:hypothetical protein